jgi:nucleotidyltransferase/DNA polymerase involved in DNA repair
MERLVIRDGGDLKAQLLSFLQEQFGKAGGYYYALAWGIDERPVCADRIRKSNGVETTLNTDLFTLDEVPAALGLLIAKVWGYCEVPTWTLSRLFRPEFAIPVFCSSFTKVRRVVMKLMFQLSGRSTRDQGKSLSSTFARGRNLGPEPRRIHLAGGPRR